MSFSPDKSNETNAKLACMYGGLIWGVFWIPLRLLDKAGFSDAWATVIFFTVPLAICLPFMIWRWRYILKGGWRLQLIGLVSGVSMALYSDAVLYTEVIRGMLLFYMTPVWSTLLARVWLKEEVSRAQVMAIILGLGGMLVIFGIDVGVPWPRNVGDWMGLAAGLIWAVAAVLLRDDNQNSAVEFTFVYIIWGVIAALVIALMPFSGTPPVPSVAIITGELLWLLPLIIILVIPAVYLVMWGTPLLNPGVVGILFMTEISVGTVTAALWADEPFGAREMLGVGLITLAGLMEVLIKTGRQLLRFSFLRKR